MSEPEIDKGGASEADVAGRSAEVPVRIVRYDPAWPDRFDEERVLLETAIGDWALGGIHHVGSTAVPGLDAKPIIDILVGVRTLEESRRSFDRLAALDYRYAPYRSLEMHWFCKPHPTTRTHHLHLVPSDSPRFRHELALRDLLRTDAELAERYRALKHDLAARFEHDRDAYTAGKAEFIAAALARSAGVRSSG